MKNVERICSFWLANELVLAKMVLILRINVEYCNMNIEDFREYCLSFKGTNEKMPFEKASSAYDRNLLVFSVFDKWFCDVPDGKIKELVRKSYEAVVATLPKKEREALDKL